MIKLLEVAELMDEAADSLEEKGYTVKDFNADIMREKDYYPVHSEESVTDAVERLFEDEDTGFSVGMDVYPEGVEHSDAGMSIHYFTDRNAFVVQPFSPFFEVEDSYKELSESTEEEATSPAAQRVLERGFYDNLFEMDKVVAAVERDLMDSGYNVLVGNYSNEENLAVNKFP